MAEPDHHVHRALRARRLQRPDRTRLTARYVESALGKTVIIDNRAGAWAGFVGTQAVANAAPDGYTFCVCSVGAISIAPFAQKIGYDPVQDLAPVGLVSSIAQVVIVREGLPVKTMAEFVAYAKTHPGKLNYGSTGAGGLTHYSAELFLVRTRRQRGAHPVQGRGAVPPPRWCPARSTSRSPT